MKNKQEINGFALEDEVYDHIKKDKNHDIIKICEYEGADNNALTVKSPCDNCIELECEYHGVVCPHYRVKGGI